jgi:hypothetical protein
VAGAKHGPNRLDRYRDIHETVMAQYRDSGFLLEDDLDFLPDGDGVIALVGTITLDGGIRLDVAKKLRVLEGEGATATVQTFAYSYNANIVGLGNILRYCSPHEDHNQFHHKHTFDVLAGDRSGTVTEVAEDDWPTLGQVFEELHEWFCANGEQLSAVVSQR